MKPSTVFVFGHVAGATTSANHIYDKGDKRINIRAPKSIHRNEAFEDEPISSAYMRSGSSNDSCSIEENKCPLFIKAIPITPSKRMHGAKKKLTSGDLVKPICLVPFIRPRDQVYRRVLYRAGTSREHIVQNDVTTTSPTESKDFENSSHTRRFRTKSRATDQSSDAFSPYAVVRTSRNSLQSTHTSISKFWNLGQVPKPHGKAIQEVSKDRRTTHEEDSDGARNDEPHGMVHRQSQDVSSGSNASSHLGDQPERLLFRRQPGRSRSVSPKSSRTLAKDPRRAKSQDVLRKDSDQGRDTSPDRSHSITPLARASVRVNGPAYVTVGGSGTSNTFFAPSHPFPQVSSQVQDSRQVGALATSYMHGSEYIPGSLAFASARGHRAIARIDTTQGGHGFLKSHPSNGRPLIESVPPYSPPLERKVESTNPRRNQVAVSGIVFGPGQITAAAVNIQPRNTK